MMRPFSSDGSGAEGRPVMVILRRNNLGQVDFCFGAALQPDHHQVAADSEHLEVLPEV